MIAERTGATCARHRIQAEELTTSDVEVSSTLADVNRVLGTELSYEDVFKNSHPGFLGFLEMRKPSLSASHVVVGISL